MDGRHLISTPSHEVGEGYISFASKCSFTGDTVTMTTGDQNNLSEILACFQRFLEASGFVLEGDIVVEPLKHRSEEDDTTD
jgi:hypothetical protein